MGSRQKRRSHKKCSRKMSEITNEDSGSKPSELYGTHTLKTEKFSKLSKRQYRSNVFEIGDHKWYILCYPQGCDVSNHLSLFLCVANHDTLVDGWSQLTQFTMIVMNKDPKRSKHSDSLHMFCKKEHDWGWKKFMELPKLKDGFIDDYDSLTIKAQVQVIRESVDRPFLCLDDQYRSELVRVYFTNVEQIFLRFMEMKRRRLIEDKARWNSLCTFWLGMDQNSRREMSRERKDVILKLVVKHFFTKDEVPSTLVMEYLFSEFNSLVFDGNTRRMIRTFSEKLDKLFSEDDSFCSLHMTSLKTPDEDEVKKVVAVDHGKELPARIVYVDDDEMFALDAITLTEKAVLEPLHEETGPLNRIKVYDEKRLSELARQTLEVFVLDHIFFNKIEVAYREDIVLKMQEELIREEEDLKIEKNKVNSRFMKNK